MEKTELREKALSLLAQEYGAHRAEVRLAMIENTYAPALQEAFYRYVETGEDPLFEYDGFSFAYVKQKTFSSSIETFRYLNSLMRDAEFKKMFPQMHFGRK